MKFKVGDKVQIGHIYGSVAAVHIVEKNHQNPETIVIDILLDDLSKAKYGTSTLTFLEKNIEFDRQYLRDTGIDTILKS